MTETTHAKLIRENEELRRLLRDNPEAAKLQEQLRKSRARSRANYKRMELAQVSRKRIAIAARRVLDLANFHNHQTADALTALKHLERLTK